MHSYMVATVVKVSKWHAPIFSHNTRTYTHIHANVNNKFATTTLRPDIVRSLAVTASPNNARVLCIVCC